MTGGKRGRIYTFYSYKGGVGRSMALANVAALMVRAGQRVLVVDWDLEAPGLEHFLGEPPDLLVRQGIIPPNHNRKPLAGDVRSNSGVVDMLEAWAEGRDHDWRGGLLGAQVFGRRLDLMSAGKRTEDYEHRISNLNWARLFDPDGPGIGAQLDRLREEWIREYDSVLIDSRTGVTDIGDICTVILPDVLVLLFISNLQNIRGIQYAMRRAAAAHARLPVDRARLVGVPIPARDEERAEYEKSMAWATIYAQELGEYYETWLPRGVPPSKALSKLSIPYVTNWSFGERLPVVERPDEVHHPGSISAAYDRLARLLMSGLDLEEAIGPVAREEPDEVEPDVAVRVRVAAFASLAAVVLLLLMVPAPNARVTLSGTSNDLSLGTDSGVTYEFNSIVTLDGTRLFVAGAPDPSGACLGEDRRVDAGSRCHIVLETGGEPVSATVRAGPGDSSGGLRSSGLTLLATPQGTVIEVWPGSDAEIDLTLRGTARLLLNDIVVEDLPEGLVRLRRAPPVASDLTLVAVGTEQITELPIVELHTVAAGSGESPGRVSSGLIEATWDVRVLGMPVADRHPSEGTVLMLRGSTGRANAFLPGPGDAIRFDFRGTVDDVRLDGTSVVPARLLGVLAAGAPVPLVLLLAGLLLTGLRPRWPRVLLGALTRR